MSLSTLPETGTGPAEELLGALRRRLAAGQRFAALLGRGYEAEGAVLTAIVAHDDGLTPLRAVLAPGVSHYAALTPRVPAAFWYERAMHDLTGLVPTGTPGSTRWYSRGPTGAGPSPPSGPPSDRTGSHPTNGPSRRWRTGRASSRSRTDRCAPGCSSRSST